MGGSTRGSAKAAATASFQRAFERSNHQAIGDMSIQAGAINRDHVHLLLAIPPHLSVSRAVQYLKGKEFT